MSDIKIRSINEFVEYDRILPNFIYNRPDIFADTFSVYEIIDGIKSL